MFTKEELALISQVLQEAPLRGNFMSLKNAIVLIASILIKIEKASGNNKTGSDTIINKVANE